MDIKRFSLTCIFVFLTLLVLNVLQHYAAIRLGYLNDLAVHKADILRMAIFSILFCFLFAKFQSHSIGNGILYGFVLCLMIFALSSNASYDFTVAKENFWTLSTFSILILMGLVASLIQR